MLVDNALTSGQKKAPDLNPLLHCEVHTATLLLTFAAFVTIAGAIPAKLLLLLLSDLLLMWLAWL